MIIYKTTNLINGKIYIGQDSKNNPNYYGSGSLISKAIKKYGKEKFKKETLCTCSSKKELDEKEKYWIKELNSKKPKGYNLTDGGEGNLGWVPSKKQRKNHSKYMKSLQRIGEKTFNWAGDDKIIYCKVCNKEIKVRPYSKKKYCSKECRYADSEVREKQSKAKLGDKNPAKRPEIRAYNREVHLGKEPWNKGLTLSDEHCKNLSESHKGYIQSKESNKKRSETLIKMYERKKAFNPFGNLSLTFLIQ